MLMYSVYMFMYFISASLCLVCGHCNYMGTQGQQCTGLQVLNTPSFVRAVCMVIFMCHTCKKPCVSQHFAWVQCIMLLVNISLLQYGCYHQTRMCLYSVAKWSQSAGHSTARLSDQQRPWCNWRQCCSQVSAPCMQTHHSYISSASSSHHKAKQGVQIIQITHHPRHTVGINTWPEIIAWWSCLCELGRKKYLCATGVMPKCGTSLCHTNHCVNHSSVNWHIQHVHMMTVHREY